MLCSVLYHYSREVTLNRLKWKTMKFHLTARIFDSMNTAPSPHQANDRINKVTQILFLTACTDGKFWNVATPAFHLKQNRNSDNVGLAFLEFGVFEKVAHPSKVVFFRSNQHLKDRAIKFIIYTIMTMENKFSIFNKYTTCSEWDTELSEPQSFPAGKSGSTRKSMHVFYPQWNHHKTVCHTCLSLWPITPSSLNLQKFSLPSF